MTRNAHPPTLLFSSLSAKIALYEGVLESAKRYHEQAKLIGADCDPNCPAASKVETFSPIRALADMDEEFLLEYCKKLELTHIIPTRDGELEFWASNQTVLAKHGVKGNGIKQRRHSTLPGQALVLQGDGEILDLHHSNVGKNHRPCCKTICRQGKNRFGIPINRNEPDRSGSRSSC